MKSPHFKVRENEAKEPHFKFVVDGDSEGTGETYASLQMCKKGIESVRSNCKLLSQYDLRTTKNGKFYFVLKGKNGEIIYTSKFKSTEIERERGMQLLMEFGDTAPVVNSNNEPLC